MTPSRLASFTHPLAPLFYAAVDSLGTALAPESTRLYRGTARAFLMWLGAHHPDVVSLHQLRRDPHILGWMTALRSRVPPLAPVTYITRLITLRGILSELAYTAQLAELGQLLRRQDVPRRPHTLPRALPAEHDQLLQQELQRRNDLGSNFFLLLRHTGMRIGEGADLAFDCLHTSGPDQWRIHVPLGKLKTERMVPIDSFTRDLVQRLRFFRSLPHQLRHTYASEMLRCGVDLPALMKMLGHASPEMTMVYLDIALTDLQREFELARSHSLHVTPPPRTPPLPSRQGFAGLVESLRTAQHVVEMYRRTLPDGPARRSLVRLVNRLTKILAELRKLESPSK